MQRRLNRQWRRRKKDRKEVSGDKNFGTRLTNRVLLVYSPTRHKNVLPLAFYPRSRALARRHKLVRSRDAGDPAAVRG
jgi:hypothetical protein